MAADAPEAPLLLLALLPTVHAGEFGLGLALGSPTGLTAAVELRPDNYLDILIGRGWDDWSRERYLVSIDDELHVAELARGHVAALDFYVGLGLNLWYWPEVDADLGVEVPFGLSTRFQKQPFELYFELCPELLATDYFLFNLNGSVGGRYYFGG